MASLGLRRISWFSHQATTTWYDLNYDWKGYKLGFAKRRVFPQLSLYSDLISMKRKAHAISVSCTDLSQQVKIGNQRLIFNVLSPFIPPRVIMLPNHAPKTNKWLMTCRDYMHRRSCNIHPLKKNLGWQITNFPPPVNNSLQVKITREYITIQEADKTPACCIWQLSLKTPSTSSTMILGRWLSHSILPFPGFNTYMSEATAHTKSG